MKRIIWILTASLLIANGTTYAAEVEVQDENELIKEAKEKISSGFIAEKQQALKNVGKIGPEKFVTLYVTEEELMKLLEYISTGSSTTETSMIRADVLTVLLKSKYDSVKIEASDKLARYAGYADQPKVVERLLGLMTSKNREVRLEAARAISAIVKTGAFKPRKNVLPGDIIEPVLKHVHDEDRVVTATLIRILLKTNTQQVAVELKKLVSYSDPEVRRLVFAYFANNNIPDEDIRKSAIKALGAEEESPIPQRAAARYLGVIGEKLAVPDIGKLLKKYTGQDGIEKNRDLNWLVNSLLSALSEIATDEALEHCVKFILSNEIPEFETWAGDSIQKITGKDMGFEQEMAPSQLVIADKRFMVWYIRDYLKEGDDRKEELSQLEVEIGELTAELSPRIFVEKIIHGSTEVKKKAAIEVKDSDIPGIIKEAEKLDNKVFFISSVTTIPLETDVKKRMVKIALYFLDDKDQKTQLVVINAVYMYPLVVDAKTVMPKLESIMESGPIQNRSRASEALLRLKSLQQR